MMGGVQYGIVRYRIVQHGPRNLIFLRILEPKKCVSQDPGPRFLDPPISQDQNSEGKEAHRMTSKLTVFLRFQLVFTVNALSLLEYFWWV
jgi:hypothetical protein